MNLAMLLIYSIPASYLAYKFKRELDRSALINIAIYLTSFFLRAFLWMIVAFVNESEALESCIIVIEYVAAFVIEISMYFFVYEMEGVRVLLRSQSPQENQKLQKKVSRDRLIACGL